MCFPPASAQACRSAPRGYVRFPQSGKRQMRSLRTPLLLQYRRMTDRHRRTPHAHCAALHAEALRCCPAGR